MRGPYPMLVVVCCIYMICAGEAKAREGTSAAWNALWSNSSGQAAEQFRASVDQDKNDHAAWRGLLLTELLLGHDDRISETLASYARRTANEPADWYLATTVDAYCGMQSRAYYRSLHEFTRRLRGQKQLPVVDRRVLLDQRAFFALVCGDPDRTSEVARELGRITGWALLGPFDNTSGSGHERMHIENWSVDPKAYEGKFGQEIRWFSPKLVGVNGVLNVSRHFHDDRETTAYLRTVIHVRRSDTYLVSLSHQGDIVFSIDGVQVFQGNRRTGRMEAAHWEVELEAGQHLLTVKLSNRERESDFALGISTLDGKPLNIAARPTARYAGGESTGLNYRRIMPEFEDTLSRRLEAALEESGNPEDVFWGLRMALSTADADSIRRLCRRIEDAYPEVAVLWLACGVAYEAIDQTDSARQAMEKALGLDPALVMPQLRVAAEDLSRKRYDAVMNASRDILSLAPNCSWALELRLKALLANQDLAAVEQLALQLTRLLPDQPIGFEYLASWAERRGMKNEARRFERDALRRRPPVTEQFWRLWQRTQQEDHKQASKTIRELLGFMPNTPWLWTGLIESQLATGDYTGAMSNLDKALDSFPQDVALLYYKALFAEAGAYSQAGQAGSRARAASILNQALNHAPGNLDLRDKQRTLRGLTPYREYLPSPDPGETLSRRVDPDEYAGQRAVVLHEWKRRLFFERDVSLLDYYLAVQVLNSAGVEAWKTVRIGVPSAGQVRLVNKTIKPDGREHEAGVMLGDVHFENLEPGDVVMLHYQSTQFQGGQLRGHTWDQHHFAFVDPCLESTYEVIAHSSLKLNVALHNQNALGSHVEEEDLDLPDKFRLRRWALRDLARGSAEVNAVNTRSYLPWLDMSTVPNWRLISDWYGDLADGQAEVTHSVREKAEELCAGVEDIEEKVERIYRFVAQNVNYVSIPFYMSAHIPREATEVLESRYGDCKDKSCLMIAMLKAVGIDDACFALIDLWGDRAVEMLPSPRFNHVIVCRQNGHGGHHWYDPTLKYGTSRQVPRALVGGLALIARPDSKGLMSIQADAVTAFPGRVVSEVTVAADGSARVQRRMEDSDIGRTAEQRSRLEHLSGERLGEALLDGIAVTYPGAELHHFAVGGRACVDSVLTHELEFAVPLLFQDAGSYLVGNLPWANRLSAELTRIVARPERRSPIDLQRLASCEMETLTISLPPSLAIIEMPPSRHLSFGQCYYSISYEQSGNVLRAQSEIVFMGDRVMPEDYQEFKQFLEAILQDQRTSLILRRRS